MPLSGTRTFVGFGFGAIQTGLFLHEAQQSGNFGRLVAAEVLPEVVQAVRAAGGLVTVNIARADGVEAAQIGPVELLNPADAADRARLIEAVAQADELATAVPGVEYYHSRGPDSLHQILAEGLLGKAQQAGPPAVLYTAENHTQAAQTLQNHLQEAISPAEQPAALARVQLLNTVIGKMSRVVTDPAEIAALQLAPLTPGGSRAMLVEAFNRILITQIQLDDFCRGITIFEEKADLQPFEEAKLYGHNALHAVAGYLALALKLPYMADLRQRPDVLAFTRAAALQECGAALRHKHAGSDPLFSPDGFAAYTDDLLARMVNPFLRDTPGRVARAPQRKLGWDDRLIGPIRLARQAGLEPERLALGAAAALATILPLSSRTLPEVEPLLRQMWAAAVPPPGEQAAVAALVRRGCEQFIQWQDSDFGELSTG
ncbi:MAG: hypothetical protein Kow0031_35380 [Anaerolineae bacterium]